MQLGPLRAGDQADFPSVFLRGAAVSSQTLSMRRTALFAAGWLAFAIALVSPLCRLSAVNAQDERGEATASGSESEVPALWNGASFLFSGEVTMTTFQVGFFVGSLAAASINRKLSMALVRLAPEGLELREIPFRDLPLYSYDYDADYPAVARTFKRAIAEVDAVLFVTPEYNRSIPGGLKNAIDWASRPWGENSFTRKPSAVIGASIGAIGTAVAQQNLRSVLSFCNSPQMNAPEAYIHFTPGLISDDGTVTNEGTREFLQNYMAEFQQFVTRVYTVLPRGK